METFIRSGIPVTEFIVAGGLLKNPVLMQIYSDVLRLPISTIVSEQGPALGSAIHAAVAAGAYPDVATASAAMGKVTRNAYEPDKAAAELYDRLFAEYTLLHDYFGRGGNDVMHRLSALRREGHDGGTSDAADSRRSRARPGATRTRERGAVEAGS